MTKTFLSDRSGVSAIEFAVIAPVLLVMVVGIFDGWSLAASMLNIRAAVNAGANYVIQGGQLSGTAQAVAMSAWVDPPTDASVAVDQVCYCSGASATCGVLCSATSAPPATYIRFQATGTWIAPAPISYVVESRSIAQTQVIRAR